MGRAEGRDGHESERAQPRPSQRRRGVSTDSDSPWHRSRLSVKGLRPGGQARSQEPRRAASEGVNVGGLGSGRVVIAGGGSGRAEYRRFT